ncbi:uncharacterized protein LOC134129055 [Pungitius pungitius]|uniref:uncharacterized protein LOC134129055 n=1 Tax=Pungitius pungitius TaxID=134920 RepID=UPI002E0D66D3
MEDEYDRETVDGGWGPAPGYRWKIINDQLRLLLVAVGGETTGKKKHEAVERTQRAVRKLLEKKGVSLADRLSLAQILWEKERDCREEKKELESKREKASVLKKGKLRKEMEDVEDMRSALFSYWIKSKAVGRNNQERCNEERPPAYDVEINGVNSASAPAGLYPVLNITGGELEVEESVPLRGCRGNEVTGESRPFEARQNREGFKEWTDSRTPGRRDSSEVQRRNKADKGKYLAGANERVKTQLRYGESPDMGERGKKGSASAQEEQNGECGDNSDPEIHGEPGKMYPLFMSSRGVNKYKPWSLGDVSALVAQMPAPSEGGDKWLKQLDTLTNGHTLALGDFRAVAARCMTAHDLADVENRAGVTRQADDDRFLYFATEIGDAMREKWPLLMSTKIPKLPWDAKKTPRAYLDECKETWVKSTSHHPGTEGIQREWFRQAVLEGVPEGVKAKMITNPDLPGSESAVWERHLLHHLQDATEEATGEEKQLKELQAQLLRLQLTKVKQEVSDKKQKGKDERQMTVQAAPAEGNAPDLYPLPPWEETSYGTAQGWGPNRGGGYRGGYRSNYRGGAGRRGSYGGGGERGGYQGRDACFNCGMEGHWRMECPSKKKRQGRGRGVPSQGAWAPNPHAAPPRGQYPALEDWGYEADASQ